MSAADNLRTFDPNKKEHIPWATWSNYGGFKLHKKRAGAVTRYNGADYAILYEMGQDGRWQELFRKCREDQHQRCTLCGGSTVMHEHALTNHPNRYYVGYGARIKVGIATNGDNLLDVGQFRFERRNGKIKHPLVQQFVCIDCVEYIS